MRNYFYLVFICLSAFSFFRPSAPCFSQTGGNSTYNFLKIPVFSRGVALGNNAIAVNDSDFTLVSDNPSLLNEGMHNNFALAYINYVSDINLACAGYARNFKKIGTVGAQFQYLSYGKFTETDIYDQKLGSFSSSEYALNLNFSKKLHPQFLSGGTIKGIYSNLYEDLSYGISADLAGTFISKNNSFVAALVFKNMGAQIKTYDSGIREKLPLDVQLGFAKKIRYAPIRVLFSLRNLQKWTLVPPQEIPFPEKAENNESLKKVFSAGYNFALHSGIGIEFMPVRSFSLRVGFDPRKRKEMQLVDRSGLIGFSMGAGIRILKINISYARSRYHFAGVSNHLSLSMNISDFLKNKTSSGN